MLKIQLIKKGINSKSRRKEKFLNIVLRGAKGVFTIGSLNRKIGTISLDIFSLIIALKNGVIYSNKFNLKWNKITQNIDTKKNLNIKY